MMNNKQPREELLTEESQIYQENIIDHYKHPHNSGTMEKPTFMHKEYNPLCGDEIQLFVKIRNNTIETATFTGQGCAISQAAASMLTDAIKGKKLQDLQTITREDVLSMLGVPIGIVRLKCALLALKTLHKGLEEYRHE